MERVGAIVVGAGVVGLAVARALAQAGTADGVPVEWLDARQARALEPALHCVAALSSPTTGIVDSHGLMLALQGDLERGGGAVALGSPVESAVLGRGKEPHVVRLR